MSQKSLKIQASMSTELNLPGYRMLSKIADGGMATVWKACQEKLDRIVAIKVLSPQDDGDMQSVERFIYEARAAATLIHPNIVQVIDAGEQGGLLYYVMEFVPGPTAGDVVDREGAMPEPRVLQIAKEVADALNFAWTDHKVVHCDIKPDNLLLHRNGRTKIADLGLAQVLGREGVVVDDDMTIGTPNYFPPEQALVEEPFDCRTDMYALGMTLYHLATGVVPFGDLEPEEVASQQVHGVLVNPKRLNPALSYGFCCLLERLLAKDRGYRYADWDEVLRDLGSVSEGKLIADTPGEQMVSTLEHTKLPATLARSQKIKQKQVAAIRSIQVTAGNTGQNRVRMSQNSIARAKATSQNPAKKPDSIWPQVVGMGAVAGLLYAWTFIS